MSETPTGKARLSIAPEGTPPDSPDGWTDVGVVDDLDEQLTLRDSRRERGTRWLFGKPYHWGTDADGEYVLLAGPDPREITR